MKRFYLLLFFFFCGASFAIESIEIKGEGAIPKKAFRLPPPKPPLRTLVYENKKAEIRLAPHFSQKIASYLAYGSVGYQFYWNSELVYDSPFRNKLRDYMMLIWEGKPCTIPSLNYVEGEGPRPGFAALLANPLFLLGVNGEIVYNGQAVRVEFTLPPGIQFPEGTLSNVQTLWQGQVAQVLEPPMLNDLSKYQSRDVWFGVLWNGQRIEYDGFYDILGERIAKLFTGDDSGDSLNQLGSNHGNLYYQEDATKGKAPLQLYFYTVENGIPQIIDGEGYRFLLSQARGTIKEMLEVRKTIRQIEEWKKESISEVELWKKNQFGGDLRSYEEIVEKWREAETKGLESTPSLLIRGGAVRHFETELQKRKSALADARVKLDEEALRRINFVNQEAVREVKELKFYGYFDPGLRKNQVEQHRKTWEVFDKDFVKLRDQVKSNVENPQSGTETGYENVVDFIKRREKQFPVEYALPKACRYFHVRLSNKNSLDLFYVDQKETVLLVKGMQNLIDLYCTDDAIQILLEKANEIPEGVRKFAIKPKVSFEQLGAGIPEGCVIGAKYKDVVTLQKGLKKRPFVRLGKSKDAEFFSVWFKKDEEEQGLEDGEVSRRYAFRMKTDGSRIEHFAPGELPEKESLEIGELLDASRRYVDTRPANGGAP